MDTESSQGDTPILVYHDFRGKAQVIRCLLSYLEIPYREVLLGKDSTLSELGRKNGLDLHDNTEIPCLILEDMVIEDGYAAIDYICNRSNRSDLLGNGCEERAIVREIFYSYLLKGCKEIKIFYEFALKCHALPNKKEEIRKEYFGKSIENSGCLEQLIKLKMKNPNQLYIFDHLTLLDFMLHDGCFYLINLFGCIEEKQCSILSTINSLLGTGLTNIKLKESALLKVLREFKDSFQQQPFYVKHKDQLEIHPINCSALNRDYVKALKNVWLGPDHFIK